MDKCREKNTQNLLKDPVYRVHLMVPMYGFLLMYDLIFLDRFLLICIAVEKYQEILKTYCFFFMEWCIEYDVLKLFLVTKVIPKLKEREIDNFHLSTKNLLKQSKYMGW